MKGMKYRIKWTFENESTGWLHHTDLLPAKVMVFNTLEEAETVVADQRAKHLDRPNIRYEIEEFG